MRSTIKILNQREDGSKRFFTHETDAQTFEELVNELEDADHDIEGLSASMKKADGEKVMCLGETKIPAGSSKIYFMVTKTDNGNDDGIRYSSAAIREMQTKFMNLTNDILEERGEDATRVSTSSDSELDEMEAEANDIKASLSR